MNIFGHIKSILTYVWRVWLWKKCTICDDYGKENKGTEALLAGYDIAHIILFGAGICFSISI